MVSRLKIGITDCGKFENYRRWIESEPGLGAVKLSYRSKNADEVTSCNGILFSGGEDLHPELYKKPEYVEKFGLKEIIPERDQFEYRVLEKSLALKKPILGVCRGLQLINVYLGGTLVPDIPSLSGSAAHGKIAGVDQVHPVFVEPGSLLHRICGRESGMVNSAHHQSVENVAASLKISAHSEPAIVEGMEWKDAGGKPWLLMVQWHPERMSIQDSPFSLSIKNAFLKACKPADSDQG